MYTPKASEQHRAGSQMETTDTFIPGAGSNREPSCVVLPEAAEQQTDQRLHIQSRAPRLLPCSLLASALCSFIRFKCA
eukprot:1819151-Rhodomonas_salina.1